MPDVGVLNLQIHENSSQAETGLNKVADALNRIKTAINGSGLKTVVSGLKGINEALTSMSSNDAENKLNRIAAALNRVKEASNFTVPNLNGINKALGGLGKSGGGVAGMEKVAESAENAGKVIEGAFETVNEKISTNPDAMQGVNDGMETVGETAEKVAESVGQSMNQIERKTESVEEQLAKFQGLRDEMHEKYAMPSPEEKHEQNLQSAWSYVQRAKSDAEREAYARIYKVSMEELKARFETPAQENVKETVQAVTKNAPAAQIPQSTGMEQVAPAVQEASAAMDEAKQKSSVLASAMEKLKGAARAAMDGFHSLKQAMSKLPLVQLGKQFLNIAKRMAIRGAVKMLTSAFKEGYANIYEYSNAIGGSFAQSLDNARASLMTMKNSLGAAVAPAIQALIPVLQTVVSWVITAANAINQLLSLLSGRTSWTKAVDQGTAALDKQKKAAAGAGGAVKDMLAAWDELNVISNDGGGGGGGGAAAAATDFAGMFEEVTEFDGWIADLTGKIKDIVTWCEEHMESVKGIVLAIGAAILGWKLATGFEGWLSKLGQWIALGAVIALTLQATWHLTNQYLKTGDEGWLWASALTGAVGATAAGVIAQKLIGGKAGLYTAAFTLALTGLTDIVAAINDVNVEGLNDKNIKVALKGALGIGAATTLAMIAGKFALGTALLAGTIVTGLVFAATVGIMAIVDANRTKFEWGDIELTEEEARRFALQKMFDVDVEATIEIISANVTTGENLRKDIELDLRNMMTDMKVINLGIADTEDYRKLESDVDSVIQHVKDYAKNSKETAALTLEFTPTLVGSTAAEQEEWFKSNTEGWSKVTDFYNKKGKEIANCFVEGENGEIRLKSPELLQTLMTEMEKVTAAIANSKAASEAYSNFAISMGDLSQTAATDVATFFGQYKEDLRKQYTALVKEQVQKQAELVAALGAIDENSKEYKEAKAKLEYMGKHMAEAVEDGISSATTSGRQLVMDWLTGKIGKVSAGQYAGDAWKEILDANNINAESLQIAIHQMLYNMDVPKEVLDIMNMVDISGWDFLDDDLKKSFFDTVFEAIGEEAVPLLAKSLKIPVEDVLKITKWDSFQKKQQASFILAIGEAYGGSAALQAAKSAGVDLGTVIGEGLSSTDGATKEKAKALVQSIRETLAASGVEVPVDASVDVLVNAMVEVEATSATAKIQNVASSAQAKVNAITGALGDIVNRVRKIAGHANGAYDIPSGELFMARENGITEYVGSIGGKPSVANNDQIEEGISKGVARANEEQNALLRQQNDLLRRILAKEMKVDLGSKASFGRTVRQSLDAYESMAGV